MRTVAVVMQPGIEHNERLSEGYSMDCPSCGGFIGLSDRVCPKCRHRLVATPTAAASPTNPLGTQCPHCGTSNQAKSGSCTHCGKDMQHRAPQPPPGLGPVTRVRNDISTDPGQSRSQKISGIGPVQSGDKGISEKAAPGFPWTCCKCDQYNNKAYPECVNCGHHYCDACKFDIS